MTCGSRHWQSTQPCLDIAIWREDFSCERTWAALTAVLAVILSAAQDLCVRRARPVAEFTLSAANGLRVTGILSKCLL